jgi:hypothetical protein
MKTTNYSSQIPDIGALTSIILHPHESPFSVPLQHKPLYWKLQEHHCLREDEALSSGVGDLDDDDFLNAWLPRGISVKYLKVSASYFCDAYDSSDWQDGIEVFDPNTGVNAHYETFRPSVARHYSESAYRRIQSNWCSDIPDMMTGDDSNSESSDRVSWYSGMPSIDDDDEYEDVVRCVYTTSFQCTSVH